MTTTYSSSVQNLAFTTTPINDNTPINLLVIDSSNNVKYRTLSSLTTSFTLPDTYTFYYPWSTPNMTSNVSMLIVNNSYASPSTLSGTGLSSTSLNSCTLIRGSNITSAIISIADASLSGTISYPCYAWAAIYRNDYSNRVILGFLEFAITTPTGSGGVGASNVFNANGLLGTASGTADGIYSVNRILKASPTAGTFTTANISITPGWNIGMELLDPVNSRTLGNLATFIIPTSAGTITYNSGRPFSNVISGYKNATICITVS